MSLSEGWAVLGLCGVSSCGVGSATVHTRGGTSLACPACLAWASQNLLEQKVLPGLPVRGLSSFESEEAHRSLWAPLCSVQDEVRIDGCGSCPLKF